MMNPEVTVGGGGGSGIPSKPKNTIGEGVMWEYLKALQDSSEKLVQAIDANSASPMSTAHVVRPVATKEAYKLPTRDKSSGVLSGISTKRTAAEVVEKQPVAVIKRVKEKNRWDNHNKQTCKCAVCMQCRGEVRSSWYKHDLLICACAVCRQARGGTNFKDAHSCGKHSLPAIPAKKGSWSASYEPPTVECRACCIERTRLNGGGGQAQTLSRFPSHQRSSLSSCGNNILSKSLATLPGLPESSSTPKEFPILWERRLNDLADCSLVHGTPAISSSSLAPAPECTFGAHHERLSCDQRFEYSNAEQQAFQTNYFGNPRSEIFGHCRCSGWPNSGRTCCANFTGNYSNGVHRTTDGWNLRRSCANPTSMSCNCNNDLSLQNAVDSPECAAGTSTMLPGAACSLFDTRNINLPWTHGWPPAQEASSAFSAVTGRNGQWNTYSTSGNMIKPEPYPASSLREPFLTLGQSTVFGGHPSPIARVQPDAGSYSTLFPEMENKPVYVPLQSSNSLPDALCGRTSSMAQFPFGLEVHSQTEHDIYHTTNNFQSSIHVQSSSATCEGATESSSPPCETTSTTGIVNEKCYPSRLMDVDSGDILCPSDAIPQENFEELMLHSKEAGDHALKEQLKYDKGGRQTPSLGKKSSKRLLNPEDSHSVVPQKRTKRAGSSLLTPKWCQLVQSKYGYSTIIRKICIRSRVSKKSPHSPRSEVLEQSSGGEKEKDNITTRAFSSEEKILECRSRCQEFMTSNCLQSTDLTGERESKNVKAARDEIISAETEELVVHEENNEHVRLSMVDNVPNSSNFFVTGHEVQDNPRDKKIKKLNNQGSVLELQYIAAEVSHNVLPCTVLQCNDNSQDDCKGSGVVCSLSDSVSQDVTQDTQLMDISNSDGKATRTNICTVNLGKTVQPAGPPIQTALTQVHLLSQGRKRSRSEEEICCQGGERRLDFERHLIPKLEDTYLSLKKSCEVKRDDGAPVGTSALCTNVESIFKVDPITTTNSKRKMPKLTVEILLPESMRVYYLTRMLKVGTHGVSTTLRELLEPLKSSVCQKNTGLVTWSKAFSRKSIQFASNAREVKAGSSEIICFGTRPRLDEKPLSRFWNTHCTESRFILVYPDRLTVTMEDLIKMMKGASSGSSVVRKRCFPSLCDRGPNDVDDSAILSGQTESPRGRMFTQDVKSIPLRNVVFPSWVDKPLNDCVIYVVFPDILLKRGPLRLLSSGDAADRCTACGEQEKITESHCTRVSSESCTGEKLEDNLKEEGEHREQISNDYVMLRGHVSVPEKTADSTIQSLTRNERTPEFPAFQVECTKSTEAKSSHISCASSVEDLQKAVASPPLSRNSECKTDPGERHSDLGKDDSTLAAQTCSPIIKSEPVRRRGCPKGGWPKKDKAQKKIHLSVPKNEPLDHDRKRSQNIVEAEADFEVVQPTNFKVSNRPENEFKQKLETSLDRPFQLEELHKLEEHALLRKPLLRLRETRQRAVHVPTKKKGMSYLDHHPDFAQKVADAATPEERLRLLRGFFFWVQHACMSGSFKPWTATVEATNESDDDCVEIPAHVWRVNHDVEFAFDMKRSTTPLKSNKRSARDSRESQTNLRTRGQKRGVPSEPAKSILLKPFVTSVSKGLKPFVGGRVKREGKQVTDL